MPLPNAFTNQTASTGQQLDQNFAALGALTAIPCVIAGTNVLTLTPNANTPTLTAYVNYQSYCGIIAHNNTGALTLSVGALPVLNVYKDGSSGPVATASGDTKAGNFAQFIYDSALNTGAGGFHLLKSA